MQIYNRLRFFCMSLYVIALLSSAKANPAFLHNYMYSVTADNIDTCCVPSHSDDIFQPVTPTIPNNPQQSFNSNDFLDSEYKKYPLPPDVSSAIGYPVACTPVNTDVTQFGAATFSIPIEVPQGVGKVVPQLSISYNSMQGNGMVGLGCSVSGLSAITRSVRDIYHDRNAGRLSFNEYDALRLDGRRLIPKDSNIMTDGSIYVLEDDPFTDVVLHGTKADIWFEVKTSDGRTLLYGYTENSRQSIAPSSGSQFVNTWYISRVEDNNGNYMTYSYLHDNNTLYPQTISYGKNVYTSNGADNTVNFIYENRPDKCLFIVKNVQGSMSNRLRLIETKTGAALYRSVKLSYSTDPGSGISRLCRVQVWQNSASRQKPTDIVWSDSPGLSPAAVKLDVDRMDIPLTKKSDQRFLTGDINGDGVTDIVEFARVEITTGVKEKKYSNYCIPYISSVNGDGTVSYQQKQYIDIGPSVSIGKWKVNNGLPYLSDINGDGRQDLVIPIYNNVSGENLFSMNVYWGNAVGLSKNIASGVSVKLVNLKGMPLYASADFDNDGRSETIVVEPSQGKSGTNVCQLIPYAKDGEQITPHYFDIVLNVVPQRLFTADFNGDGMTDFMIVHKDGCYTYINKGDGYSYSELQAPVADINVKYSDLVDIGDFNGDGIPDAVMFSSGKFTIASGNGDGHFTLCPAQTIVGIDRSGFDEKLSQALVYDFNGDGRSDLVIAKADKKKGHTLWLRSLGTSFSLKRDVPSGRRTDSTTGYYALGDFNGDGFAEVINYGYDAWGSMGSADTPVLRIYPNNVSSSVNKVRSITDGMGNCAAFTYKSLVVGGLYKKRNDAEYPMLDCTVPLNVVSSVKRTNGAAGENSTVYAYEGLKVHMQGKGLLGMTRTTATNRILGTAQSTETTKWNTDYYVPLHTRTVVTTGDATETSETTAKVTDKGNKALFIYPKSVKATDADGNITEKTVAYNAENGTLTTVRTSYNDGSYVQAEYGDYVKKGGMWLARSITERRKHADDKEEYTDRTKIEYDGSGNVTGKTTHADTQKQVKTTIWHGEYGNVSSYISEGEGISEIECYNGYDATGRFLLKKDNDTTPASMSYTYDVFGNLLTETDDTVEDNPLTTRHNYNSWGQEVRTTTTEGAEIKTWYGWGPDLAKRYYKLTFCFGQPWQKTWYDSCGRVVMTESVADGGILSTAKTTYNSKGLETGIVQTTGKLSVSTEKEYDSRGRITSVKSSSGKNLSYSYANRQVAVTDNGRSTVKVYDAQGNVRKVTDPLATIEYKYYSSGKPSAVSCNGNTVRMEYDEAGNRTLLDDPDAGRTLSVYDAEGKLLSQTDGRGVNLSFNYDGWGRLSSKSGASTDIMYSYDKYDNVTSVWHDSNRIVDVYDKYNRVVEECRCFNDGETQVHKYEYDKFNNVTKETFPGGLRVDYACDSYGNCTAYIIDGDTVWAERQTDGQAFEESIFSGKLTRTKVLDNNGYLKNLDLYKAGIRLRSMKYKYDGATGNMTCRETVGSGIAENFFYDDLDRLVKGKVCSVAQLDSFIFRGNSKADFHAGDFPVVNPSISVGGNRFDEWCTTNYTYSADGNILSFPVAGNYTYSQEKPHAVIGVTNPGGKIPSTTQDIDYNDINKVDEISDRKSDGWHVLDFYYGPDNERWITENQIDNGDVKSVHYGDSYEKVKERGNVREFTYLGNGLLYYNENGCKGRVLYMFTDAQGSITDIFDADGNSVYQAEYDPWGNMTVTRNDIGFIRGYTGHEMLPEFGLINMNGRMYDPRIGRFLSPDNYIQMPENSQSFNRYSYCLNNPLKYTDPSGDFWNVVFGAAVGGLFNWASHGFKYNAKGLGYFFTGAVAGAVSTGVASGVNVAMAGGNFWNGAAGMANGISSTGFLSGAASGAASGFAGGFISGFGNSLIGGGCLEGSILLGLEYGLEGGFAGGILSGVTGGIDALDKGTDFWNGSIKVSMDGAFSCVGTDSDGIWDKLKEECQDFVGKYVGDFEGQRVYESKILGTYSENGGYRGFTRPDKGIFVGKKVFTGNSMNGRAMMQHEFGHVLQYRIVGAEKYYNIIAKESSLNCAKIPPYNNISHDLFWTETWANHLSKQYFGTIWHGLEINTRKTFLRYYPARDITKAFRKEKFGF